MSCEEELVPPDPFFQSTAEFLFIDSSNSMQGPLKVVPGSENQPSITNKEDTRDGFWFDENKIAASIDGLTRFLIENDGMSIKIGAFIGKLTHSNTADREYTLPDKSGTIALLDDIGIGTRITATNASGASVFKCTPVYLSDEDTFDLTNADNDIVTSRCIGLVYDTQISDSESGYILVNGELEAETAYWDLVTGETGGLTPKALYYIVSGVEGKLSKVSPKEETDWLCRVGQALSETVMLVKIEFLGRR